MLRPHDDDWGDGDGCAGGDAADPLVAGEDTAELPVAVPLEQQQQRRQQQPVTFGQATERAQHDAAALHGKLMAIHQRMVAAGPLSTSGAIAFFDNVERKADNKQQLKGDCIACGKKVASTASTRLVLHILKCPLMPIEVVKDFKKINQISTNKACGKREAEHQASEEAEACRRRSTRRIKRSCSRRASGLLYKELSKHGLTNA